MAYGCKYYAECKERYCPMTMAECNVGLNRMVMDISKENEFLKAQIAHLQDSLSYDKDAELYE